ncbi:MAG: hypothetical protein V4469_01525 [Patescibacteria group bacterium]
MEKKEFEKLTDQEKLLFYDEEIKGVLQNIEYEEANGVYFGLQDKKDAVRKLERRIENLRSERSSLIDRINIGLSNSSRLNKSNQIFIASWFDSSTDSSITAIEEGIREAGFEPRCIKDEHFSEPIMDKALGEIRKSRLVVVDLTGKRPSVFFEAGFAHGAEIETVYVYKKDEKSTTDLSLEFYVKHYKCYSYSNTEELKEKVKDIITARIKSNM